MNVSDSSKRLLTIAYGASFVMMSAYTLWLYAMGSYRELLIPMFTSLILLVCVLLHVAQGIQSTLPRLLLLASIYGVVLSRVYAMPEESALWLGLPIAATFLLLSLWVAMALNAACLLAWWWLTPFADEPLTLGYGILVLLLALPPWEHARRRALLRATDPNDSDCDAYHIDTLKERLKNEFQRASMLNKRLVVLVLHLPQLDMAAEQFGHRAQSALLGALCREVNSRCRDHDILGRAGNATFWLVLPDTSESGALLVRERLQRALSRCVLVETGQLEARIATCLPLRKESFERYVKRLEARANAISDV